MRYVGMRASRNSNLTRANGRMNKRRTTDFETVSAFDQTILNTIIIYYNQLMMYWFLIVLEPFYNIIIITIRYKMIHTFVGDVLSSAVKNVNEIFSHYTAFEINLSFI